LLVPASAQRSEAPSTTPGQDLLDLQELRDINEKLNIRRVHTELTKAGKFNQLHDQVIVDERRDGDRLAILCVAAVWLDVNWLREELDKLVGRLSAWHNDHRVSYF
jgi:hypothetical protein